MFSYIGLKRKIENEYVGMFGIKGVGLRVTEKAICLYVEDKSKFVRGHLEQIVKSFINKETKNYLIALDVIIEDDKQLLLPTAEDVFKMRRRLDSLEEEIESIKNAL